MTYLDWIIVSIVAGSVFLFALRGFVRQAMGVLILTAAVLGAWMYREPSGALLQGYVESAWLREISGFFGVFFSIMLLGSMLTWSFVRLRNILGLGFVDRLLGMALGAVAGFLLVWGLLTLLREPLERYSWWQESHTAALVFNLGAQLRQSVDFEELWQRLQTLLPREGELPETLESLQEQLRQGGEEEPGAE